VKGFLTIHEFATLCRTTVRTIRFYDKKGILKPASVDSFTGYRYYHPHQTREFFKIKLIQTFDVPLKEIGKVGKTYSEESFLNKKLVDIKKEIEEKQKQYNVLRTIKNDLIDGKMKQHIKVNNVGPFFVFGKEFSDARYDRINADITDLYRKAKELGLSTTKAEHVLYLEPHEYGPHKTRLRISLILSKLPKSVPDGYYAKQIPNQKVLTYLYKGPYEYLTFVHKEMYAIAKKRGFLKGYSFDMHPKGPLNSKSVYDYETLVGYPME
jgi:DNA-binding transcriptional MerR regulator